MSEKIARKQVLCPSHTELSKTIAARAKTFTYNYTNAGAMPIAHRIIEIHSSASWEMNVKVGVSAVTHTSNKGASWHRPTRKTIRKPAPNSSAPSSPQKLQLRKTMDRFAGIFNLGGHRVSGGGRESPPAANQERRANDELSEDGYTIVSGQARSDGGPPTLNVEFNLWG
jgi:hypothetical protein